MSFDLDRFVRAQEPVMARVLAELRAGRKETHWMWFVFPQVRGLGRSAMAERYAIGSRVEAEAYLAHPVLGSRLRECTRLAAAAQARSASEIFAYPDDLKFRSSMTLFDMVEPGGVFRDALDKYFGGQADKATLELAGDPKPRPKG